MSKRDYNLFLQDILDCIKRIEKYTKGYTQKGLEVNELVADAVVRNLEIIGEAARNIPVDLRKLSPEIPWKKIIGFRNIVIHEYFRVDLSNTWIIVKKQLPGLKKQINAMIKELNSNEELVKSKSKIRNKL